MQQYCLYLRKSRADLEAEAHGEMETLARHEKALLDLAKRMSLPITQIYKEIVSGETINARPVVQQLLSEVEQGMWSGVLVMEVERLARGDTIDQGVVARAFKMAGTKIITPVKVYDPDNEYDEEYFEFGLFMSRREYKTINRRIQRGRLVSAKEGKAILSTPPYGYDRVKIKNGKGWTLAPKESEAKAVKYMFNLYNAGNGMTIIARKLDELGIKPRHIDNWSKASISDILKNPVYIGMIRWAYNVEKKVNIDGEIKLKQFRNENYIYVKGLHPAIITKAEFDRAQKQRIDNTHKGLKKDLSLKNPLSGIVYCKKCGGMMGRLGPNAHVKYDTIKCYNRYCDNISAPLSSVENKLIISLKAWLADYKLKVKKNTVNDELINTIDIKKGAVKSCRDEIAKLDKQISQTYDLVESGVYTTELFIQRNKELADRKAALIKMINESEDDIRKKSSVLETKNKSIPHIEKVLEKYESVKTIDEKNSLLKSIIARAEYLKTEPNRRGNAYNDNFELIVYPILPGSIK